MLAAWVDGALSGAARDQALSHIADCADCREIASALMRAAPAVPDPGGLPTVEAFALGGRSAGEPSVVPPPGYVLGETIGRGGMGSVIAAQDLRIGREVAVKRMATMTPDDEQLARFLREARIQARLEHPAIVPVHELSVDELGRPFFTMKRITGQTLGQRLADGVAQNRLLRVFVDVCRAIEFAHARGVVHRDLKPPNIMLGDYGETYVIDWGIARVLANSEAAKHSDIAVLDPDGTRAGAVLGTPGYMSPEQVRGEPATTAADVYALGAILFELLTARPLHERGQGALASTLHTPQVRPSDRYQDTPIPPELDDLCFAALAEIPDERPTAHDLAEQVQAYLDGDRDLEQRRSLAGQQLAAAHDALATGDPDARALAIRRAGRALALDPESHDAAELVGGLLLEPPPESRMPADLIIGLKDQDRQFERARLRLAAWAYLSVFIVLPFLLAMEIKNWGNVIVIYGLMLLGAALATYHARSGRPSAPGALVVTFGIALMFPRLAGPFVITPLLVCCVLAALTAIPSLTERPWIVMIWMVVAVMTPIGLEWVGWFPVTWAIGDGSMTIVSDVVHTRGRYDELALMIANLVFTGVVAWLLVAIHQRRRVSERQLFILAWHLRQLMPQRNRPGSVVTRWSPSKVPRY
jgi:serine/threonine-protein kinase